MIVVVLAEAGMSDAEFWIGVVVMLLVIGYAGCRVVMELWGAFVAIWHEGWGG